MKKLIKAKEVFNVVQILENRQQLTKDILIQKASQRYNQLNLKTKTPKWSVDCNVLLIYSKRQKGNIKSHKGIYLFNYQGGGIYVI